MAINPTLLFSILSLISIIYFLLGWYTKLYTLPIFAIKMSCKTHLFFTLVYISCYVCFLLIWFISWYSSILAELVLFAAETMHAHPDFDTLFPEFSNDSTGTKTNLPNKNVVVYPAGELSIDSSKGPGIDHKTAENESVAFTPLQQEPKPIKSIGYDPVTRVSSHFVLKGVESETRNPKIAAIAVELTKALSPNHTSTSFYPEAYLPEALSLQVPTSPGVTTTSFFGTVTLDGQERTAYCVSPKGCLDAINRLSVDITGSPRFGFWKTGFINMLIDRNDMGGHVCVVSTSTPGSIGENEALHDALTDADYSPPVSPGGSSYK